MDDTSFATANRAQLDEYIAENDISISGWSRMTVADKRTAVAAYLLDAMNKAMFVDPADGVLKVKFPPLEDADKDTTTIKIIDAMSNPVHLYVHGTGYWSIRIGETVTLPVDAVSALGNSDVKFDEV